MAGDQAHPPSTEAARPSGAVFLSHASEDLDAARRISDALRAAGIEVWFDESELRGGDVWDRQIRHRIRDCALFVAVISHHTEVRHEGYFRREWKLAVERTHDMAEDVPFLLPVVVDDTPDSTARVPDRFHDVQWSRLPGADVSATFVERVRRLLSPAAPEPQAPPRRTLHPPATASDTRGWGMGPAWVALGVVLAGAVLTYIAVAKGWFKELSARPAPSMPSVSATGAFAPPPHSVAVLPFVNMSGDPKQEYFSDGLTEEVLNSLTRVNELQVAARTSSFAFKGKDTDIGTIARKLDVGAILEGSVRRSGRTVRITAQLINAVTGFHLWSQTYDRDLRDVLQLQTEIANAVASALKVTLLSDASAKIEAGGTKNPAALDAYLRASKIGESSDSEADDRAAVAGFTEAINLDPHYASAYAARSMVRSSLLENWLRGSEARDYSQAQADAERAIALAPELAEGHLALAQIFSNLLDFRRADQEYERARSLAPGNARVLSEYGRFTVLMGRRDEGVAAARRSVVLDPLSYYNRFRLAETLSFAGHHSEAVTAAMAAHSLAPDNVYGIDLVGLHYYFGGDAARARTVCEGIRLKEDFNRLLCLAMAYHKLGLQAEADAAFARMRSDWGDDSALFYAIIESEWGENVKALDWLDVAMHRRDPYLIFLKTLLAPLSREPRYQTIVRSLNFPD